MGYIGIPNFDVITPTFPKEDFNGSNFGTVNGFANSVQLTYDVPGFNAVNCEVLINNVQQEPDVAYTIEEDANSLPRVLRISEALNPTDDVYIIYKGIGTSTIAPPAGSITGAQLANNLKSFTLDSFTGDGSTVTFTMSEEPTNADTVIVSIDGILQKSSAHYSVSGFDITFTSAPDLDSEIEVRHLSIRTTVRRGPDFRMDSFTGDGTTVSFTIGNAIGTYNAFVFINGVQQIPATAYNITNTTLTFSAAPSNGDQITVRYQL